MSTESYFVLRKKEEEDEVFLIYCGRFAELNSFIQRKCGNKTKSNEFIITEKILMDLKLELQLVMDVIKDYTENELYYFEEKELFPNVIIQKLYSSDFDITTSFTRNISNKIIKLYSFIDTALEIIENNSENYDLIYIVS